MPSFLRGDVVLVRYPFSDLSGSKVRPAVVVSGPHESNDVVFVPMTSKTAGLRSGEFVLADFASAGLNVPTAAKRGFHTLDGRFLLSYVGRLSQVDLYEFDRAVLYWLGLNPGP